MKTQNFENHSTLKTPTRNFIFFVSTSLLLFILAVINLLHAFASANDLMLAVILLLCSVLFISAYFLFRSFSLKAQDRAIRAEENLRHFVLNGKLLDSKLKISQITALRFASDDEFIALADKAAKENLGNTEIKKLVKNWRADYHRA
jgi:Family of unknown function (DUF6526)